MTSHCEIIYEETPSQCVTSYEYYQENQTWLLATSTEQCTNKLSTSTEQCTNVTGLVYQNGFLIFIIFAVAFLIVKFVK